ncbi:MAG: hypothetical protein GQF41_1913 [Candidatus Rifleibacterium amylolyticum]|nr:MAG: hypothetical protein GQF41_1913 [Candidatus Rifleibacterium amylolyticum]NLF96274.1 sel1 repeat family protein [Candidatus Riflebacteria bacterium]
MYKSSGPAFLVFALLMCSIMFSAPARVHAESVLSHDEQLELLELAFADFNEKPEMVLEELKELAERDGGAAYYALGLIYSTGQVVTKSEADAFSYFMKSAEKGYAPGQHAVGYYYFKGDVCKRDVNMAAEWFEKAAQQSHAGAAVMLAYIIDTQKEYNKDQGGSVKWNEIAAKQGLLDAQYSLAVAYALGKGVKEDRIEAYKWYLLASKADEPQDEDLKANVERVVKVLDVTLTAEQKKVAQSLADEFVPARNFEKYTESALAIMSALR